MPGTLNAKSNKLNKNFLSDHSEKSEVFEQASDEELDSDYEMFDWWDEFDDIIEDTHPKIKYQIPKMHSINRKIIDLKGPNSIANYKILQEFMSLKSDKIRNTNKRIIRPEGELDIKAMVQRRRNKPPVCNSFVREVATPRDSVSIHMMVQLIT